MTPACSWRLCFGAVLLLPALAQSQAFSWQSGVQTHVQSNSNPGLQTAGAATLVSRTVSASLNTVRNNEVAMTQGDAELILEPGDGDNRTTVLGRLSLRQRLSAPRETWVASLAYRRDRTLDGTGPSSASTATNPTSPTASDAAVGRSDRRLGEVGLSWSHALSERLSSELGASHARTEYAAAAAGSNFSLSSASAGLSQTWRETTSLSATLSRTDLRPLGSAAFTTKARIDSLRLSVNEVLSETGSAGVSVARSVTARDFALTSLVCPLPVQFCQSGITRYVVATTPVRSRSHDMQYSANASLRWDETTALATRLARALTPGALGVTREDVFSLSASRSFSETTQASLAFDLSRSLQASAGAGTTGGAASTLRSLSVSASHRLGEQLTLSTQLQSRHYQRPSPQVGAAATVFSINLQYQGATVPGWR